MTRARTASLVSQMLPAKEEVLANGAFAFMDPFDVQELDRVVALALEAEEGNR